ncbi:hypothetical protein KEM60_00477 [Austwickia sp. TVS 96-490-7B]|uniref:DUF2520 domain-containing protein n=1 Tax=Austwickia sp. TVS 96-490-7B TaxID=2830843 RepID=UPI001C5A580D|nr:DUF2520 domain-containing protein [Austwickia sp. TVS 96-490-7B]MBW3084290.1 hypothetical protein [Austwickia sp. TVS 96-490-7B]
MTFPPVRQVGIYGTGRLAGSLAAALHPHPDVHVCGLTGRDRTRADATATTAGVPSASLTDLLTTIDLLIIAVSDTAIPDVAEQVAAAMTGPTPAVVHCSGAQSVDILAPLARRGAATAVWHPLQAFPTTTTIPAPGITWTLTGGPQSAQLVTMLQQLTHTLSGRTHLLDDHHRAAYHAAAVLAANLPTALLAHAATILTDCGFTSDNALDALLPLTRSALDALAHSGIPHGMTGPVMRGDIATIQHHLNALDARPQTAELYRACSHGLLPYAQARALSPDIVDTLTTILDERTDHR